jgi:AAA domain
MQHPTFVTPERMAQICRWPTSDRRQIAKRLGLKTFRGGPIDYRDEQTFWRELLVYLSKDRTAYRDTTKELSQLSVNGRRRSIHRKCFENLRAICPEVTTSLKHDKKDEDFAREISTTASQAGAINELADWLWAHWLAFGEANRINSIIEADPQLRTRFGTWRAVADDAPIAEEAVDSYTEEKAAEPDVARDEVASLLTQLRTQLSHATETLSLQSFLDAKTTIDEVIGTLERQSATETEAARATLRDVIVKLRSREALGDAQANERRTRALEMIAEPPALSLAAAKAAAIDILEKLEQADHAKHDFEAAAAAHLAARFDREKLQAYHDATARYGDAEDVLTDSMEKLLASADSPNPTNDGDGTENLIGPADEKHLSIDPRSDRTSALDRQSSSTNRDPIELVPPSSFPDAAPESPEAALKGHTATISAEDTEIAIGGVAPAAGRGKLETNGMRPEHTEATAVSLAGCLLVRGNIGLFATACEVGRELGYNLPPPEIAIVVGTSGLSGSLQQLRFANAVHSLMADTDFEYFGRSEVSLLFGALCLPAIIDPTFASRNLLSRLKLEHADFSAAIALREAIDDLGRAYSSTQEFLLTGGADPEDEFKKARALALQTANAMKVKTVSYHAATVVAHRLAQDLTQAAASHPGNIDEFIRGLDRALPIDQDNDELIRRLDREVREDKADRKPIEARALTSLRNLVREAKDATGRLRRAATVLRERRRVGAQSREATHRKGLDLRTKFKGAAETFRNLANAWSSQTEFASISALTAAQLLEAHANAFETGVVENPFCDALDLDHYRLPAIANDPDVPENSWKALQTYAERPGVLSWLNAFDAAVERQEHRATQGLLRVAQPLATSRNLVGEREEAIAQVRGALRNERQRLQDELLTLMNYAPPGETSLDPLYQSLASIDPDVLPREPGADIRASDRSIFDFPEAFAEIARARGSILAVKTRALKELELRLKEQEGRAPAETIAYLRKLIDDGDLITLSEELSLIERGQDIVVAPSPPIVVEEFSRLLMDERIETLAEWQRIRKSTGGRADALIRKWQAAKQLGPSDPCRAFRDLFGELGFEPRGDDGAAVTTLTSVGRVRHFKVRTRVLSDREFCSIARFGSEAQGQYRIILTGKDSKPNEIVTAVPEGDTGATFVFVPQWVGKDIRLQIASEARRLSRTFCLIDDAMIAFLCDRDRVIHDLFGCGIPFAAASPYVTTPGSIPVEAFFGRTAELANIGSRDGSCIVYGGRQLGKSVLLDHIEQKGANSPARLAIRLDCQDLTERRELLRLIERKLPAVSTDQRGDILELIESWLRANPERTILLMLDETNKFVRADADRDFDVLLEFRGMMERTNRRFKVVLSGQNNVLRLTQTPNTPLAHFGQPICIGPLKGGDYKAARDLVAEPLAAVGYKFAEEQLISRILVETQFYPKLVQMFCRDLLNHLRTLPGVHSELPPWKITLAHIEATLRNQRLTRETFETFKITLDLDKRYELIALIMALERSDQRKSGSVEIGMTEQDLRDKALYWWKDGFTSANTREEFEGLLEELEGLGILINDRSTHSYQLASPVIANLIGSEESIYDRLLSFERLPPNKDVEPSKRRADDNPAPRKRGIWLSPLVPGQVNRIVRARRRNFAGDVERTFVIYGSPDMRLDRIRAALEPQKYDEHQGVVINSLDEVTSNGAFGQRLASASRPTFFIVPSKLAWDATWVDTALRSERGHVIVFAGDLAQAWSHIVDEPRGIRRFDGVRVETAAPLSAIELEDQFRRHRIAIAGDVLAVVMSETGGFLNPVGQWTERHSGSKRDQRSTAFHPHFETLPPPGRHVILALIDYVRPEDNLDTTTLRDVCDDHDPKRVCDWLLLTGLADFAVGNGEQLRLNKVFWSDAVRQRLTAT